MQIILYQSYGKKLNSTGLPPAATVTKTVAGYLKDPCSITEPIIKFQNMTGSPDTYTYAYIPAFHRYYYVSDWRWENALWTAYLTVDVLASYRTQIGEMYAYIERCAGTNDNSVAYDGGIVDDMYPPTTDTTVIESQLLIPWNAITEANGTYIIGVIQQVPSDSAGGAVSYYAMNHAEMHTFMQYLLSDQFYDDAGFTDPPAATQEITLQVAKGLISPIDYVVSCMWFPCAISQLPVNQTAVAITIGPWYIPSQIAVGHYIQGTAGYRAQYAIPVHTHPQSATRGRYLNQMPYTERYIIAPPFGTFTLDGYYFDAEYNYLSLDLTVDVITGAGTLDVSSYKNGPALRHHFKQISAQFGVPIQLAQLSQKILDQVGGNLLTTVFNIAKTTISPIADHKGVQGSFIAFNSDASVHPVMIEKFFRIEDEDNADNGRPLSQIKRLDTINGYAKCAHAAVNVASYDKENRAIKEYLETGFFRE